MKKIIIVVLALLVFTGCSVVRIDTDNVDTTIDILLSKDNDLFNRVAKGYKYYIPKGVTYIDTNDLNEKLYSNGVYYYLYIDAIGYYYETENNYEVNEDAYYSRVLKFDDKTGYVEINEYEDDKYHISFSYNYAQIEAIVEENQIENTIMNASYILSTVKFNSDVIKIMLNEDYFTNKEETYDIFNKVNPENDNSDNFLEYNDDEGAKLEEKDEKEEVN